MLRKRQHLRYTHTRIREIRYSMVNHCLIESTINSEKLKLYACLIKKYQRKYKWIQM